MSEILPITLCMITRNEEDRIAASLGAVREHVERMVVLDAESNDRTAEIARQLGAAVVIEPWAGFVAARRRVLEMCESPWTLMIDADEVVEPGLWEELARRGFPESQPDGFQIRRRTVYEGCKLRRVYQPDWKTALFKTDRGYFEDRLVHESVRVRGRLERLRSEILHHSFRSAADQFARIEKYAQLAAEDLARRGKRAGPLNLWLRPAWRWFTELFLLGAIVDGRLGIVMANRSAYAVHRRYEVLRRVRAGG